MVPLEQLRGVYAEQVFASWAVGKQSQPTAEVAATGGAILIKRLQAEGSPKVTGSEFAGQYHVRVGDKLGE